MPPADSQKINSILDDPRLALNRSHFSGDGIRQLQEFCQLLLKWNQKINLVSQQDLNSILENHVFDSLQYLRWLKPPQKILDIGSGAGFPGVVLKILCPEFEVTLIEAQRKRCNFLREVGRVFGFVGFSVLEGRAQTFACEDSYSGQFDRVVFRGFSSLASCLATGGPFLQTDGAIILLKNPDEEAEFPAEPGLGFRLADSLRVEGYHGKQSLLMAIEKCSTWNNPPHL